jgi:GH24 family phage-related lysozyme (muramidase)
VANKYRLSYEGQLYLLKTELNIPYVYDDKRVIGKNAIARYEDAIGNPTFGLGIKIDTPEERALFAPYLGGRKAPDDFVTQQNAKVILEFENVLNKKLENVVLTPSQFDALFSLAWNKGPYSDIVNQVISLSRQKRYAEAGAVIADGPRTVDGKYNEGLAKRRASEAEMFLRDVDLGTGTMAEPSEPVGTQTPAVVQAKPIYKEPEFWMLMTMATAFSVMVGLRVWARYKIDKEYPLAVKLIAADKASVKAAANPGKPKSKSRRLLRPRKKSQARRAGKTKGR